MNKKGKKTLGLVLLFTSLIMIIYGAYLCVFNPKNIMLKMVVTEFDNLFKSNNITVEKKQIDTIGYLEIINNNETLKTDIKSNIYIDQKNQKTLFDFILKSEDTILNSSKVYLEGDKLYFKLDEQFPLQYIELVDSSNSNKKLTSEFKELKKIVEEQILINIPNKKFTKLKENVTVNDNNLETTKYNLELSYLDTYNVINSILLEIYSNENIPVIKQELLGDIKDIEQFSKDLKTNIIGQNNENDIVLTYSIYVLKDKIVKHEFRSNNNIITIGKYEKETGIYDYELTIKEGNKTLINTAIVGAKDSSKINVVLDSYVIDGELLKSADKESLNLNLYLSSAKDKPVATLSYEKPISNNLTEYSFNLKFELNDAEGSMKLNLDNKISNKQDVPEFDITGATKFSLNSNFNTLINYT